jgi:hypothetical protein
MRWHDVFERFWAEVVIFVLLDTLGLVRNRLCHPCFFKADTLFDIRRTRIFTMVFGGPGYV